MFRNPGRCPAAQATGSTGSPSSDNIHVKGFPTLSNFCKTSIHDSGFPSIHSTQYGAIFDTTPKPFRRVSGRVDQYRKVGFRVQLTMRKKEVSSTELRW